MESDEELKASLTGLTEKQIIAFLRLIHTSSGDTVTVQLNNKLYWKDGMTGAMDVYPPILFNNDGPAFAVGYTICQASSSSVGSPAAQIINDNTMITLEVSTDDGKTINANVWVDDDVVETIDDIKIQEGVEKPTFENLLYNGTSLLEHVREKYPA